jgi:hypothetical protein
LSPQTASKASTLIAMRTNVRALRARDGGDLAIAPAARRMKNARPNPQHMRAGARDNHDEEDMREHFS